MIDGEMMQQCCLLHDKEIRYSQPGDQILYHREETMFQCRTGWTGDNCDICATNFGPPGSCDTCLAIFTGPECDACAPGWTGPDCQYCEGFGFSTESNCTQCIQNGYWKGRIRHNYLDVHLTFTGESCSELVLGKFLSKLYL